MKTNNLMKLIEAVGIQARSCKQLGNSIWCSVDKNSLPVYILRLQESKVCRLTTCLAYDNRPFDSLFHVVYVIDCPKYHAYICLDTGISSATLELDSVGVLLDSPPCIWCEWEIKDLYGVRFANHPGKGHLVLPDNWPPNHYPLRKDAPPVDINPEQFTRLEPRRGPVLPLGPFHPALHEPELFELIVDGERIVDVRYRGFFVYRGIEKLAEERFTYNQVPFLAERICGICGFVHSITYCRAVENALGVDVPEEAKLVRTLLLELERIHSHILWVAVVLHTVGFDTGFMLSWKTREHIMHLAEILTGNRKTYGMDIVGGVRRDVLGDRINKAIDTVKKIRAEYKELYNMLINNTILVKRTRGVGVLPREKAISYGVVGPVARGAGLDIDVRKDHPYAAYKELSFNVPVYSEGDVLAITLVRLDEVFESLDLIEQILDKLPRGPIMTEVKEIPANKEAVGVVEAPRGEDIHYVRSGEYNKIQRWRVRAPSYANIPPVREMLIGYRLADAPIIYASVDPCLACTERYLVIDIETGKKTIISDEELKAKSRKLSRTMG